MYLKKDGTDGSPYQQRFMKLRVKYYGYIPVYTDGSQDGNSVASGTDIPLDTLTFTAEVWTVIKALEQIRDSVASKYIICTDSLSCL